MPYKSVKYLGIWLDEFLNFKENIARMKKKAQTKVTALARGMPNTEGPLFEKRRLAVVAKSTIIYRAYIYIYI